MSFSLNKLLVSKFGAWLVAALLMIFFLYPPMKRLNFGIDLVGGTYITLNVDTSITIEKDLKDKSFILINFLKEKNINFTSEFIDQHFIIHCQDKENLDKAKNILEEAKTMISFNINGLDIKLFFSKELISKIKEQALDTNIEVLRNRLNSLGVEEVSVGKEGDSFIVIELPNVQDPQQAKTIIGTSAVLEFKIVEDIAKTKADLLDKYDGEVPFNMSVVNDAETNKQNNIYYLVNDTKKITGSGLKHASLTRDKKDMRYVVQFEFDKDAGLEFSKLTKNNINRSLAIILDNKVISAPNISCEIGSSGTIQGNYDEKTGNELAMLLRSGSFVAPISFEEERTIEPSLGKEAIHSGLMACLVGLGLLFFFSLFYYGLAGLFAFTALIFNLIVILFGLSKLGAALTLPGIAGMVLTVGMAIDASILIFESMREINLTGASALEVLRLGFSDALVVILDANITTLIVGVVLFYFGTGPIKGFAVTMMLGIISTLITGLFFLRSLFTAYIDSGRIKKLNI